MLFLPPRHGKSELAAVRYPVYRLERTPATRVVIGAYNQTFAEKLSRRARRIARDRLSLSRERNAAGAWETDRGGGVRACGVGSPPMGEGADLLVIDDPVKKREEADSPAYREKVWEWYSEELLTRLEPGAAVVLIMTRWHHDDVAGRILAGDDAPSWEVVCLRALAEEDDPLGRPHGAALCPDRYDEAALARIRRTLGTAFEPLYQQRATAREGGMFRLEWFSRRVPALPAGCAMVRYWDKAGTAGGGAYTAGVLMARDPQGYYFVADVTRAQLAAADREKLILATAHLDRARFGHVAVYVEQEPADAGKESAEATVRMLAGFAAFADRATGSKEVRAEPFASQCGAGNVALVGGPWIPEYLAELVQFPRGAYVDQVDASSGAFAALARTAPAHLDIGTSSRASPSPFAPAPQARQQSGMPDRARGSFGRPPRGLF